MATLKELFDLQTNSELRNRVMVACTIAAEQIRGEEDTVGNHANRVIWARQVFRDPPAMAIRMFWALLASNSTLTQTQIANASDADIQAAVTDAVDLFADGSN